MCLQSLHGFGWIYTFKINLARVILVHFYLTHGLERNTAKELKFCNHFPLLLYRSVLKKDRVDKNIETFYDFLQTYFTGLIMMYFSGTVTLSLNDSDVIFILLWTLIAEGWNISWSPCKNYMLCLSMEWTRLWLIPCEWPSNMETVCGKQMELKGLSSINVNKKNKLDVPTAAVNPPWL